MCSSAYVLHLNLNNLLLCVCGVVILCEAFCLLSHQPVAIRHLELQVGLEPAKPTDYKSVILPIELLKHGVRWKIRTFGALHSAVFKTAMVKPLPQADINPAQGLRRKCSYKPVLQPGFLVLHLHKLVRLTVRHQIRRSNLGAGNHPCYMYATPPGGLVRSVDTTDVSLTLRPDYLVSVHSSRGKDSHLTWK